MLQTYEEAVQLVETALKDVLSWESKNFEKVWVSEHFFGVELLDGRTYRWAYNSRYITREWVVGAVVTWLMDYIEEEKDDHS